MRLELEIIHALAWIVYLSMFVWHLDRPRWLFPAFFVMVGGGAVSLAVLYIAVSPGVDQCIEFAFDVHAFAQSLNQQRTLRR